MLAASLVGVLLQYGCGNQHTPNQPPNHREGRPSLSDSDAKRGEDALQETANVQVKIGQSGWWYLSCKVQSKDCAFLLDTGAPVSCLHTKTAKGLNIQLQQSSDKILALDGREVPTYRDTVQEVEVAKYQASSLRFKIYDIDGVRSAAHGDGVECDGILGANFFHLFGASIDFQHDRLLLRNPHQIASVLVGEWTLFEKVEKGAVTRYNKSETAKITLSSTQLINTSPRATKQFPFYSRKHPDGVLITFFSEDNSCDITALCRIADSGKLEILYPDFTDAKQISRKPIDFSLQEQKRGCLMKYSRREDR